MSENIFCINDEGEIFYNYHCPFAPDYRLTIDHRLTTVSIDSDDIIIKY